MTNPFEMTGKIPLLNIANGKSVKSETRTFQLNIDITGNKEKFKLIDECRERSKNWKKESRYRNSQLLQQKLKKKELHQKMGRF